MSVQGLEQPGAEGRRGWVPGASDERDPRGEIEGREVVEDVYLEAEEPPELHLAVASGVEAGSAPLFSGLLQCCEKNNHRKSTVVVGNYNISS